MKGIKKISKTPQAITPQEYQEIIELHQAYFNIEAKKIIELMLQRKIIILYRDEKSNALLGTVGLEWLKYENSVCLYIGNTVIGDSHSHEGMLQAAVLDSVIDTCFHFPFDKKYVVMLATTPKVYSMCLNFSDSWPKQGKFVTSSVQGLMEKFVKSYCSEHYTVQNGVFIIRSLNPDSQKLFDDNRHAVSGKIKELFSQLNPHSNQGDQLLCVVAINPKNFFTLVLHNVMAFGKRKYKKIKRISVEYAVKPFWVFVAAISGFGASYAVFNAMDVFSLD